MQKTHSLYAILAQFLMKNRIYDINLGNYIQLDPPNLLDKRDRRTDVSYPQIPLMTL